MKIRLVAVRGSDRLSYRYTPDNPGGLDMSISNTLILTRPIGASERVLKAVEQQIGCAVPAVISPVMEIVPSGSWVEAETTVELVLTSSHAIQGPLDGKTVHCVGEFTATQAHQRGGIVGHVAPDGGSLIEQLSKLSNDREFMHLCGSHKAVDIAMSLENAGLTCRELRVYAQEVRSLSKVARQFIEGEQPSVLPLYSPRSARLVGSGEICIGSNIHVICLSDAIAEAWIAVGGSASEVITSPNGDEMVNRIVAAIQA